MWTRTRMRVLLNRGHKNDIGSKEAEKILECPVVMTFPNDYKTVLRAFTDNTLIDKRSDLGHAYANFSRMLMGIETEKKSSFLGIFGG